MLKIPALEDTTGQHSGQPDPASQPDAPGAGPQGTSFNADHAMRMAQYNEAGVRNAQANWLDGMNALLYDPQTGFLNQQGAAAMGSHGPVQDAVEKLYKQATDNLGNETQRGIFGKVTGPILNAFQAQIQQHAANQYRVFDADASQSRALAARDLAINAYNPAPDADNTLYRNCTAICHNELENLFRHTAPVNPGHQDYQTLNDHHTQFGPDGNGGILSLHTGIINRLLENNQPNDARTYLDQIQHTLPEPTRDKLDQYICTATDQSEGHNAALQAQARETDPAKQQTILDDKLKNGQINPGAHAVAQHKLQADNQQKLAAQTANDKQILTGILTLKANNPNAAITDIPASDWAYLKSRGLDQNAQAILDSHPATDDPKRYNDLHRLANQDPVKFAQTNLLAESGNLSQAHLKYLQSVQDAITKQNPQEMQASKIVNDAINTLHAEMKISGITPTPEPGSPEEKKQAQTEADLRDQLIAAQQAKNGTPLTPSEAQNLAMGYFADHVLKGKGGFGRDGGGQEPSADGAESQAQPGQQHSTPTGGAQDTQTYVMKKGDTLWGISHETGIPLEDIRAANPQLEDPTKIPIGVVINLPLAEAADGGSATASGAQNLDGAIVDATLHEPQYVWESGDVPPEQQQAKLAGLQQMLEKVPHQALSVVEDLLTALVGEAWADTQDEVLMDPGHGDHNDENSMVDSGAVAKHGSVIYKEKDLALQFSNTVGNELARLGHTVSYTRTGDVDNADLEKLKWRIDIADKKKPNAFISIHLDSAGKNATGLSVYANKEGSELKKHIEDAVTVADVRDAAPKSLFVLRNNKRPAILIEVGFITNPDDVKAIQNPDLAKQVAAGIDAYFKSTHTAESHKK